MNRAKPNSPYQWLKWWASGAVCSTSPNPDHDPLMAAAARHHLAGRHFEAMIFRVEAGNDRRGMVKAHKPNIGPCSPSNPFRCVDCGKPGAEWIEGEACIPAAERK